MTNKDRAKLYRMSKRLMTKSRKKLKMLLHDRFCSLTPDMRRCSMFRIKFKIMKFLFEETLKEHNIGGA